MLVTKVCISGSVARKVEERPLRDFQELQYVEAKRANVEGSGEQRGTKAASHGTQDIFSKPPLAVGRV